MRNWLLPENIADILPAFAKMKVQNTPDGSLTDVRDAKTLITVRHLLTMTGGFDWNESLPYTDPRNTATARLSSLCRQHRSAERGGQHDQACHVQQRCRPEDAPEFGLGGLVAQHLLGDKRAGPATRQREQEIGRAHV